MSRLRVPDFLLTPTFRLAAIFAVTFAVAAALLFGFIYWQTALFETARIDAFIVKSAALVAEEPRESLEHSVSMRVLGDLHRISFAALFDSAGLRVVGNLESVPDGLPPDGQAHEVEAVTELDGTKVVEPVRAVARRLGDGTVLVIGRNIDELQKLRDLVLRALGLGVIPAFLLALAAGAFVSRRAQDRVKSVHRAAERIMQGDLKERLPTLGTRDDFDRLARSVNYMLDEIHRLLESVKASGDDIAHDLRTPLARLRTRLERARYSDLSVADLQRTVDAAINDLDQTLGLITTLLRIGEIDSGRRRSAFEGVDLAHLVDEVVDSYEPLAEEKSVSLTAETAAGLVVRADRGLLLEAVANIVQNAIKFIPPGGRVKVSVLLAPEGPMVRVADTGPGIPEGERERVFDRFYRGDKSRSIPGSGLGLSLVASIAKLHGFTVTIRGGGPGAVFELLCRPQQSSE
jgi:signal transduction histidine kinase